MSATARPGNELLIEAPCTVCSGSIARAVGTMDCHGYVKQPRKLLPRSYISYTALAGVNFYHGYDSLVLQSSCSEQLMLACVLLHPSASSIDRLLNILL